MADDNRILQMVLEVKDQDVVKATTNVAALESRIKKLVKAQQSGKITDDQFAAGKRQITNSLSNMANVSKNKAERAVRSLINTERALTREVKVNTVALSSNAKASQNASVAMNQYGTVSGLAGKKLNTFNMKIQQGGYQLQDFAVQMQGGTSFFTAFAQQGSQFAGVFGPTGAVVGAVIAIGSAVAGMAYKAYSGAEEVKTLSDQIEDLASAFDLLESTSMSGFTDGLNTGVSEVIVKYETLLAKMNEVAEFRRAEAMSKITETIAPQSKILAGKTDLAQQMYSERLVSGGNAKGRTSGASTQMLLALKDEVNIRKAILSIQGKTKPIVAENLDIAIRSLETQGLLSTELRNQLVDFADQFGLQSAIKGVVEDAQAASEAEIKYSEYMAKFVEDYEKNKLEFARKGVEQQIRLGNRLQDEAEKRAAEGLKNYLDTKEEEKTAQEKYSEDTAKLARMGVQQQIDLENRLEAEAADRAVAFVEDWKKAFGTVVHLSGLAAENMMKYAGRGTTSSKKVAFGDDRDKTPPKDKTLSGTTLDVIEAEANARMAALRIGDDELVLYERQLEIRNALGDYSKNYTDENINQAAARLEVLKAEEDQLNRLRQQQIDLANTIASSMGDAIMSMVDGTKSAEDAFKSMAAEIIKELYRVLVVQQMVNAAMGVFGYEQAPSGSYVPKPNANGNAFSGGNVIPFASGGVVGSPTYFGMGGGQTGLMGEAGPEAIMPLKRGPDGKLGVSTTGGSQSITVVQNINVSTGVQQTVRAEVMGLMPQIAAASKAAVLDAKRRGGSFGGSFR
jgi:phage-related minor tail protein